jgi:hypothetical protein
MEEFNLNIKSGSGRLKKLDKLYRDFVKDSLDKFNEDSVARWEVYNAIISELRGLGEYKLFQEIQYRFTDGENPNLVMIDIANRLSDDSYLIWLMKSNLLSFIDEDFKKELT